MGRIGAQLCAIAGAIALLLGGASRAAAQDSDGDGLDDAYEQQFGDSDGDGIPDAMDPDDDDDGIFTRYEYRLSDGQPLDTDGDQTPDYLDADDDDDGLPTAAEDPDPNGDHIPKDAVSHSWLPDYLSADDDGDGVPTRTERPQNQDRDTDQDQKPDHLDQDDDGDGFGTDSEVMIRIDLDTDRDGIFDYLDADDDGDGILTKVECDFLKTYAGLTALDVDDDGIMNCFDLDSDDDTVDDKTELTGDRDHDGVPDYLDADTLPAGIDNDDDGVPNARECPAAPCPDGDGDGKADIDDDDDDGDRVPTRTERGNKLVDTDGDGTPDAHDTDDDDDTVATTAELAASGALLDTDHDGVPNHRDADDNGDGIPTRDQGAPDRDTDGDGVPDYLQLAAAPPLAGDDDGGSDASTPARDAGTGSGSGGSGKGGLATEPRSDEGCSLGGSARGGWLIGLLLLVLGARANRRRSRWVALSTLAAGCGGSDGTTELPADAAVVDAGIDASARDAGYDAGSARDAGNGCVSEPLSMPIANSTGRAFAAAVIGNRVHVAYLVPGCGAASSATTARGLRTFSFATTGAASAPSDLVNTDPDVCAITRDPALAVPSQGTPTVFFSSDARGSYATYQGALTEMPAYAALDTQTSGVALAGTAGLLGDVPTLAYRFSANLASDVTQAAALAISQPGRVQSEVVAATLDHWPAQISLADVGGSGGLRGVVAWRSDRGSTHGLYYRHVDAFGAGSGDVVALGGELGAYSAVRVAGRSSGGGAIVYTLLGGANAHVLRFRPLAVDGTTGDDVALTGSDQDVAEFAVTSYTDGYAVAYRRHSDGTTGSTSGINLLLVDPRGKLGGARFVANVGATQGIEVFTANDGRLVLLFTDVPPAPADTGDLLLRIERLTCL